MTEKTLTANDSWPARLRRDCELRHSVQPVGQFEGQERDHVNQSVSVGKSPAIKLLAASARRCSRTLGAPKVLLTTSCTHALEWPRCYSTSGRMMKSIVPSSPSLHRQRVCPARRQHSLRRHSPEHAEHQREPDRASPQPAHPGDRAVHYPAVDVRWTLSWRCPPPPNRNRRRQRPRPLRKYKHAGWNLRGTRHPEFSPRQNNHLRLKSPEPCS